MAVFSAKGGQGKTVLAVNLAVTLRLLTKQRVALLDADLRFGNANILLDLSYQRSIVDLLPHIDELDSGVLEQVMAKHSSGVEVLMRPERAEMAEAITASAIEKVLTVLARSFDYAVIDCEVTYDERLLAVLDRSDVIFIVLQLELGALRNTKHFMELAETLGYPRGKIAIVLNRANSNVGLTVRDVENALGPGEYFRLNSYGRQLSDCGNRGQPVVLDQPKSEFARIMHDLARHVLKLNSRTGDRAGGG